MGNDLLGVSTLRLPARRAALLVLSVTALALAALVMAKPAQAATFTVNSTADKTDANTGDSVCDTSGTVGGQPECTLRAAIQQANATSGADTINVPAGTYTLTISQSGEPNDAAGDLDLTDGAGVTITGVGPDSTIIDAGGKGRAFEIRAGTTNISGITITGGDAGGGSAAASWSMVAAPA